MPAEIILQARKENEVVIEGEVHLVINEDTPSDIVIEVPNQNGRLLSKEMLSNNTLVSSDTIKRPVILVPENNSIGFTGTFVLSPYEPSETYSGVPTGMRIEISTTEDFSTIMKNVVIDELLTEVPVTFEESSEVLYARVKYVSDSHVSGYSDVVKFTNSDFYVYQPKILTPTLDATGVARTPFVQVSDYQYMGNENYYAGLTYEVATDSNFTNIVETDTIGSPNTGGSGSSNGVYLNNFIVDTILDEDTVYYVRVKYLGVIYPESIWSDVISFKTFNIEEKVIVTSGNNASFSENDGIAIDTEGNMYVAGCTNVGTTYSVTIMKLDKNLNVISKKNLETTLAKVYGFNLFIDDAGNIIVTGMLEYTGRYFGLIFKLDNQLNLIAQKKVTSGVTNFTSILKDIIQLPTGEYLICGTLGTHTLSKGLLLKLDSSLNILAQKTYSLNGNGTTVFHKMVFDNNGNIILAGTGYNGTVTSAICIRINITFVILAQKFFTTPYGNAGFNSVFVDSSDNIVLSGTARDSVNEGNYNVILDSLFNVVKHKSYGTVNFSGWNDGAVDGDGNYIFIGMVMNTSSKQEATILKTDKDLNIIKQLTFTSFGSGNLHKIKITKQNEIYITGRVYSDNTGTQKGVIFKLYEDLNIANGVTANSLYTISNGITITLTNRAYGVTVPTTTFGTGDATLTVNDFISNINISTVTTVLL